MTGFLEEAAGVRSMTRLAIGWLLVLATVLVAVICWGAVTKNFDAPMVAALGGALLTLVFKGAVAIKNRNGSTEDAPK